jgi:hypothetical protein
MMAFVKKVGAVVVGLAVLIGFAGKFSPHWFMSLPFPLSIILWSSTGHSVPPCKLSEYSVSGWRDRDFF